MGNKGLTGSAVKGLTGNALNGIHHDFSCDVFDNVCESLDHPIDIGIYTVSQKNDHIFIFQITLSTINRFL